MSLVKYASVKLYLLANALDGVLTVIGANAGLSEANPVMAGLLSCPAVFIAVKLAGGIVVAAILALCPRWLQRAAAAFMGAVAIWNAFLILLMRG